MNREPISPQLPDRGALEREEEHSVMPLGDGNSRRPDEELLFKSFSCASLKPGKSLMIFRG